MEEQESWIGHESAKRRYTEHGVRYRDLDNQTLAIVLGAFEAPEHLFKGVSLWDVDGFVERLEAALDPSAAEWRYCLNLVREHGASMSDLEKSRQYAARIVAEIARRNEVERHDARDAIYKELLADKSESHQAPTGTSTATPKPIGQKWTDDDLRLLRKKSIQLGMTNKKLADEYGVTPQLIGQKLKEAKSKLSSARTASLASVWPSIAQPNNSKQRR